MHISALRLTILNVSLGLLPKLPIAYETQCPYFEACISSSMFLVDKWKRGTSANMIPRRTLSGLRPSRYLDVRLGCASTSVPCPFGPVLHAVQVKVCKSCDCRYASPEPHSTAICTRVCNQAAEEKNPVGGDARFLFNLPAHVRCSSTRACPGRPCTASRTWNPSGVQPRVGTSSAGACWAAPSATPCPCCPKQWAAAGVKRRGRQAKTHC